MPESLKITFVIVAVLLFLFVLGLIQEKVEQWEQEQIIKSMEEERKKTSRLSQSRSGYGRVKTGQTYRYSRAGGLFYDKKKSESGYNYRGEDKKSSSSDDNFNTVAAINNMQGF